jgi:hypothetical protein
MELWLIILLSIVGLILLIGIIRVISKPYTTFGNLMLEVMLLDVMGSVIVHILEAIGDGGFDC